mmetsp:Transcript_13620/g.29496  ORF Transcript_13620/g.29496 Transcript_13620/m.29496 type:complete len:243 (-) Transcript_13620:501-1229(-)
MQDGGATVLVHNRDGAEVIYEEHPRQHFPTLRGNDFVEVLLNRILVRLLLQRMATKPSNPGITRGNDFEEVLVHASDSVYFPHFGNAVERIFLAWVRITNSEVMNMVSHIDMHVPKLAHIVKHHAVDFESLTRRNVKVTRNLCDFDEAAHVTPIWVIHELLRAPFEAHHTLTNALFYAVRRIEKPPTPFIRFPHRITRVTTLVFIKRTKTAPAIIFRKLHCCAAQMKRLDPFFTPFLTFPVL